MRLLTLSSSCCIFLDNDEISLPPSANTGCVCVSTESVLAATFDGGTIGTNGGANGATGRILVVFVVVIVVAP